DYKIPWLLVTLLIPIAGFMIYIMFYNRKLSKKQMKRISLIENQQVDAQNKNHSDDLEKTDKKSLSSGKTVVQAFRQQHLQKHKCKILPYG
ncbi:MAG: hypothetical protein IJ401_04285, partial [Oscillospiraceae bacterium]|nr:hypothetical protein [Oscillospiraceae bacterium]